MKRVGSASKPRPAPRVPSGDPDRLVAGPPTRPGRFQMGGGTEEVTSTCLNCPDQPCLRYSEPERPKGTVPEKVCPTDAFAFASSAHAELDVSEEDCIGCGMCVMRCPYDSLHIDEQGTPALGQSPASPSVTQFESTPESGFEAFDRGIRVATDVKATPEEKEREIAAFVENAVGEDQGSFYPLVTSLFTSIGLPASESHQGDTSNRIDVLVFHPDRSMPVEVKSPAETPQIDIKSVQQALENKVVVGARRQLDYPSDEAATTLSVGYRYPSERSDVAELVGDIQQTYGVKVGLLSLRDLYDLVWDRYVKRTPISSSDLESLLTLQGRYER